MTKTSEEILAEVDKIFATKWVTRQGQKVPDAEDVQLGNDAVKLEGTVLYADMTDSTGLVKGHKDWFAAEIYKSYLVAACHVIRNHSGSITSFDGDRVMAVFYGERKNSDAAKSALKIAWVTRQVNERIQKAYPTTSYQIRHAIGVDSGPLFIARTGIRNNNDLVWVGSAANYAAKLCELADSTYTISITAAVYDRLSDDAKFGGEPRRHMWNKINWESMGTTAYQSNWWWQF